MTPGGGIVPTTQDDAPAPPEAEGVIAARIEQVRARIRAAEQDAGRPSGDVALLAVSKGQDAGMIRAAHAAGQRAFGESYLQEALDKQRRLADLADIEWHFVGRIQANKTRSIAASFDWVHSLCDLRHATRLNDQRPAGRPPLQACLQINLSGESSKAGLEPAQVAEFLAACRALPRLRIRGLMTLPAPTDSFATQRIPFLALRRLRDGVATPASPLDVLSMGMSDDLEAAIAEGATIVRLGTAIFGDRTRPGH
ncbi:YggS family pyridoxal phosphate-dependent enzyme [Thioalkalicoccus limnaeus]|uniref:Pyridoxal phosphate homeostasis protein n=1 Tax=Thioalkalicoccus limnaeus TaxID=120681 RepID=A0ABV4BFX5_9GAMM